MVSARRVLEGEVPLSAMPRLSSLLDASEGRARYLIEFGRDELHVPYARLQVDAELPLVCQRSMQAFVMPARIEQALGLIRDEADEAALPPGYEALLVPEDGLLRPADLVEDELVLAVPVVPLAPDAAPVDRTWSAGEEEMQAASPFAALASLKKK